MTDRQRSIGIRFIDYKHGILLACLLQLFAATLVTVGSSLMLAALILASILFIFSSLSSGYLSLFLFNVLYSVYLIVTASCYYQYIDIYLLESLNDPLTFRNGFALMLSAQLICNSILLFKSRQLYFGSVKPRPQSWLDDFLMLCITAFALLLAVYGYKLYGGFFEFLATPYDPVFEGSAENSYKHVIIATAGILNTSLFCYFFDAGLVGRKSFRNFLLSGILFFIQFTFFLQGKREYLVETVVATGFIYVAYRAAKTQSHPSVGPFFWIFGGVVALAAAGLAIRSEDTSAFKLLTLAIGYEAQFTVATFLNSIYIDNHFDVSYDYLRDFVQVLVIVFPRDLLMLIGLDKDKLIEPGNFDRFYVENKGGQFIFTSAYADGGAIAVLLYAFIFGLILVLIDSESVRSRRWVYAVAVTYLWVALRKDVVMAFKYYFTGIIMLLVAQALVKRMGYYFGINASRSLSSKEF